MLYCYGENSFTFLLFHRLESLEREPRSPHPVADLLIGNCKDFKNGTTFGEIHKGKFDKIKKDSPEIWLFPNFGKRSGFGEPDALVLVGGHSFWFEVETSFNLRNRKRNAETSLTQLFRFFYFAQALKVGHQKRAKRESHWAIMGPTVNGKGNIKDAILRMARHPVLGKKGTLKKLSDSIVNEQDHYVIFSDKKMKLKDAPKSKTREILNSSFESLTDQYHAQMEKELEPREVPSKPDKSRFWYQYYEGDLKRKVKIGTSEIEYIRIPTV